MRLHGDLGARTRIAGHGFDFDDAVIDFRHFLLEQGRHELRMRARQEDLRSAGFLAHVHDVGTHPVAVGEMLARDRFIPAQKRLGAAQVDDHVAVFDALDQAVDDLADAVLVFLVLALALGLADLLDDDLLGGLGGDAPEVDGRQGIDQEFADHRIGLALLGLLQGQLGDFVLDGLGVFDDLQEAGQGDRARHPVDDRADVVFMPVFGAPGLLDRLFHGFQDLVPLDALVTGGLIGGGQQFRAGVDGFVLHDVAHFRCSFKLTKKSVSGGTAYPSAC